MTYKPFTTSINAAKVLYILEKAFSSFTLLKIFVKEKPTSTVKP